MKSIWLLSLIILSVFVTILFCGCFNFDTEREGYIQKSQSIIRSIHGSNIKFPDYSEFTCGYSNNIDYFVQGYYNYIDDLGIGSKIRVHYQIVINSKTGDLTSYWEEYNEEEYKKKRRYSVKIYDMYSY